VTDFVQQERVRWLEKDVDVASSLSSSSKSLPTNILVSHHICVKHIDSVSRYNVQLYVLVSYISPYQPTGLPGAVAVPSSKLVRRMEYTTSRGGGHQLFMKNPILLNLNLCKPFLKSLPLAVRDGDPHLTKCFMDPQKFPPQTGRRSVQPFLHIPPA